MLSARPDQTLQKPYKLNKTWLLDFQDLPGGGWQNHESLKQHCLLILMVSGGSGLAEHICFLVHFFELWHWALQKQMLQSPADCLAPETSHTLSHENYRKSVKTSS